jgi:hypothetical protein
MFCFYYTHNTRYLVLTQKLLKQGYVAPQLKSVVQRMYGRHHERVYSYTLFISQMAMDFPP